MKSEGRIEGMSNSDPGEEPIGVITRALRPSKKSDVQYIIASELAAATLSKDPLLKIRHICEAFLALSEEQREALVQGKEGEYEKIYKATISLMNIRPSMENPNTLIIPWVEDDPSLVELALWMEGEPSKAGWEGFLSKMLDLTRSGRINQGVVLSMKGNFVIRVMPKMISLMSKILENFVSQEVWEKTIEGLGGKKHIVKAETGPVQD